MCIRDRLNGVADQVPEYLAHAGAVGYQRPHVAGDVELQRLSLIHISEPTRPY